LRFKIKIIYDKKTKKITKLKAKNNIISNDKTKKINFKKIILKKNI
jgi:hypothetical protein